MLDLPHIWYDLRLVSLRHSGLHGMDVRSARSRALDVLGPLEGRIMDAAWAGQLPEPFVVRDVHEVLADLAYTTVMTTVSRLATKGILGVERSQNARAHRYRVIEQPAQMLERLSRGEAERAVARFGDAAFAAFTAELDRLSPAQRERLRRVADR